MSENRRSEHSRPSRAGEPGGSCFAVLGPLEVRDTAGAPVPVARPRSRRLLAALLVDPGQVVPIPALIERVWGGEPPGSARAQVHAIVSALRRDLPDGDRVLRTNDSGYALEVTAATLDALAFAEDVASADADPGNAATHLRAAFRRWRGEPFSGVAGGFLDAPRQAYTERYLAVVERLADLELEQGAAPAVADELRVLVGTYPLREGLRRRLMLALYRCGAASEALESYRAGERLLAETHGLDPAPASRELAERIRSRDPDLRRDAGGDPRPRPVPRQLPPAPTAFSGRAGELAVLDDALAAGEPVIGIVGTGGVGKTALATRWAHAVSERFPDGQHYVDLLGYAPEAPRQPADVLASLLRARGVAPADIPAGADARATLFRSTMEGSRTLLLLDNARDAEQVRPLLPAPASPGRPDPAGPSRAPGGLVVVTSRADLGELPGTSVTLRPLSSGDAVALLGTLAGPRVTEMPEVAMRVAARCARLPLALRIAAERAVQRADTSLAALADELADEASVLSALAADDDPQTAMTSVFSWSYRQLREPEARAFRLLGLHRGGTFDVGAAAAIWDVEAADAAELLAGLRRAHLVEAVGQRRFTLHDLLRVFAMERAVETDEGDRRAVAARAGRHYLGGAAAAMNALYPTEHPNRPPVEAWPTPPPPEAREWFDVELPNLLALDGAHVVDLGATVWRHLETLGRYDEAMVLCTRARTVAERAGDRAAVAVFITVIGLLRWRQGHFDAARDHLRIAATTYHELGDRAGEAWVLLNLGVVAERTGHHDVAARHLRESIAHYTALGDHRGLADALGNLGVVYEQTGAFAEAVRLQQRAFTLQLDLDNPAGQANALGNLGVVHYRSGDHAQAVTCLRQARTRFAATGDRAAEAEALAYLGASLHALGETETVRAHLERAMELARDIDSVRVQANALNGLGELASASGDTSRALAAHTAALRHAQAIGDAEQRTRAESGIAAARHSSS